MSSSSSEGERQSRPKYVDPFKAVRGCQDIAALNEFVRRYLAEHHLSGEAARRTSWALFYAWKG